jgi:hypothetical protein
MAAPSPGVAPSQAPVLMDVKACEQWLAHASLADPRQACQSLTTLLEELEERPPHEAACLEILERLRDPITVANTAHARKFTGRPLPLREHEAQAFDEVFDLWSAYARGFRRLLRAAVDTGEPSMRPHVGLLCERAASCTAELISTHYRARREVDSEHWQALHELYRLADAEGVAEQAVPVKRRSTHMASLEQVYVRALLIELAHPYALSARDLQWTRRWAGLWAHKVELGLSLPAPQGYAVDLAGEAPPTWTRLEAAAPTLRFLDTTALRRSVKARVRKLDAGEAPESLGLGKDVIGEDAARLLAQLLRAWTEPPASRQFTRRIAPGRTEVLVGLDVIHAACGGKLPRSAGGHWDYSRRDAEQIAIYGAVAGAETATPSVAAEKWDTLDESANGFKLRRKSAGERVAHRQLIAAKPEGARAFILSEVRWLMVGIDRALTIGAHALPGLAEPVSARARWAGRGAPEPFVHAFLISSLPGGSPSLVLPAGRFQQGRYFELRVNDELRCVRLDALLQHGADFDRVAFTACDQQSAAEQPSP